MSIQPRTLGLLLIAVLGFVTLAPRPALGCSCREPIDPRAMLAESDAAFVGTMVDRRRGDDEFDAVFVFEVEQWVKSDLGSPVEIHSGSNSALCGWEQPTGQRIGLLVSTDGDRHSSGLCNTVDPDVLLDLREKDPTISPRPSPPIVPEPVEPASETDSEATTTARVALGLLAAAAVTGFAVPRLRRRSAEEQ